MLRISGIKKSFGKREVLKDISFDAPSGLLTIIEGQNGAGKSTIFNIISGIDKEDEGSVKLKDLVVSDKPPIERAKYIAILRQDPNASSVLSFSILDNFILASLKNRYATLRSVNAYAYSNLIKAQLQDIGLDFELDLSLKMGLLSGGQRQLLAFAMATLIKPELLLLDEPTAALDDRSSHLLMRSIKRLVRNLNIPAVMISHDRELDREYGDQLLYLNEGEITSASL